ncbi:MAG: family 20 glycosylhydrolase [Phycisphaerae bacterium]|nr:family 20 glycosylhydrolase [Phycisphaerae bacterium]
MAPDDVLLIPPPRRVHRLGGATVAVPLGPVSVTGDAALVGACVPAMTFRPAAAAEPGWLRVESDHAAEGRSLSTQEQGYCLRISPPLAGSAGPAGSTVNIRSASRAGLRHGLMTLRQLIRQFGGRLPCVEIDDAPSFRARGAMLDVSRDRIPTMAEFDRIIDTLAELKFNHLQLYTEHTFAYAGHDAAWQGWSPVTPDEVRRLDERCAAAGIELAANQNCFGHLAHWLRLPAYRDLAETHGDWMFDVWPRSGPFSLCPTDPRSLALVEDWLSQLLPCFRSDLVNIGCDETYDVGWGRSREACERLGGGAAGRIAVYLEFVAGVCRAVRRHGKRPMLWADVALSHTQCVRGLPTDAVALAWGYEPDAPFETWCRTLLGAGLEAWVCPGTSSWRSIAGRTAERHGNLAAAAAQGLTAGAGGMLVCDWGDTGHHQVWPVALMGLAHGAQAAWNGSGDGFDPAAAGFHALGDRSLRVGPWLEALGDADEPLRRVALGLSRDGQSGRLRNQGALFADLHGAAWDRKREVGPMELWQDARARVADLATSVPDGAGPLVSAELRHAAEVMRFAADRAVLRRSGGDHGAARLALRERLAELIGEHRRLWLVRSRPGGLEHSVGFYRSVRDDLADERAGPVGGTLAP